MEAIDKHYKKIIVFLCSTAIIALIAILFIAVQPIIKGLRKPTLLSLNIAPSTAKVEINGTDYTIGVHELEPGDYTGRIHQDGFAEKTISFTLEKGKTTTVNDYVLNEAQGFSYFERSSLDITTLRQIKDDAVANFLSTYDNKLSIRDHLPILLNDYDEKTATLITGEITDGSKSNRCDYDFCLIVDCSKSMEWRAKEVIELAGFKYEDYRVIYAK